MKKIYGILFLVAVSAVLTGCYEDKGNYDYREINSLTIQMPSNSYSGTQGDLIEVIPEFTFSSGTKDESPLKFRWTLSGRLISTERNLRYTVDTMIKSGRCELRVTDTRFNVDYIAWTQFDLSERYGTRGWMVLSDKTDESILSFFAQRDINSNDFEEYPDVFRKENNKALGSGPIGMQEHFYTGNPSSNFWIVQREGGCMDINAGMWKDAALEDQFLNTSVAQGLHPRQIFEMSWITALVNENGALYTRKKLSNKNFHTGKFVDIPVRYNGKALYVDRIVISRTDKAKYALLVEGQKGAPQRLMALLDGTQSFAGGVVKPFTVSAANNQFTAHLDDLNGYELMHVGYLTTSTSTSNGQNSFSLILRKNGQYIFQEYQMKVGGSSGVSITEYIQAALDWQILDGSNLFYNVPIGTTRWLLVTQGEKLYYVDRLTIGKDQPILIGTFNSPIVSLDAESLNSATLGVGLANGGFHVVKLDKTIPADVVFSTQVPGRIVQVRYKANSAGNGW